VANGAKTASTISRAAAVNCAEPVGVMHFCHLVVILLDVARAPSIMENTQTDNHTINPKHRMMLGRLIGTLIVLGALVTGILVWRINYQHPRTNDAMVRANIVGIAPEVSGRIVELHVEDNQYVKKGELLFLIDPRPYQAKLAQARAELLLAEKDVDSKRASSGSADNAIERLKHQRTGAEA